jgi:hypothetical protein
MGGRPVANRGVVPTKIENFNKWLRNTNVRQLATNTATTNPYWTDYGWTLAQSDAYTDDWYDVWVTDLYPKWSDKMTKTKPVNEKVKKFMKDFVEWIQEEKLIEKIRAAVVSGIDEETIFNIVLDRAEPTKKTEPIGIECFLQLKAKGRGLIGCEARADKDETRPSIPREDGADSVQYAWIVFSTKEETAKSDLTPGAMTKDISTKAAFTFDAGFANQGKWLVMYARWYNTKHPGLAGEWSVMQTVAIS